MKHPAAVFAAVSVCCGSLGAALADHDEDSGCDPNAPFRGTYCREEQLAQWHG
jgi:hypothetical protein